MLLEVGELILLLAMVMAQRLSHGIDMLAVFFGYCDGRNASGCIGIQIVETRNPIERKRLWVACVR